MRRFYWIKEGLQQSVILLAAAAIYPLIISVMDDFQKSIQEYMGTAAMYLAVMAALMPTIFNHLIYGTTIPLSLSLGATRKEAWMGLQLYRLAMLLPALGGVVLFAVLGAAMDFWLVFVLVLSGCLFFGGVGGVLGALSTKLSRGRLLMIGALAWIGCIVLIVAAMVFALLAEETALICILPVLGLLIYGACTCYERKAIRDVCVK